MASFSAGTTFTDGVANDVTAAKLGALVNNATPTSGLIQDRTAETATATNDTLLIGDASDSNNLKRITVANFAQTLPTAKITTGTIETGTFGTTTSTAATITTGTITTGVIPALTAGTTTSTVATITTGTIPTLVATTLITSGTGTAAAPAIVPTGDTNNGLFFPAADNIAVSTNGTERVRVDSSGNVGIGATPTSVTGIGNPVLGENNLVMYNSGNIGIALTTDSSSTRTQQIGFGAAGINAFDAGFKWDTSSRALQFSTNNTERLRIDSSGNVGIGTASPATPLNISTSASSVVSETVRLENSSNTPSNGNKITWRNAGQTTECAFISGIREGAATSFGVAIGTSPNFTSGGTNAVERLRIDSSGNVGIGTASPSVRLHVSGLGIYNAGAGNAAGIDFAGNGNTAQTNSLYVGQLTSGISAIFERGANPLTFHTNSTERLRIDSSGFVSIGTATALSALHVHGNVTLSNTTTATSAGTGGLSKPATYAGYLTVSINGTSRKIPYYAT